MFVLFIIDYPVFVIQEGVSLAGKLPVELPYFIDNEMDIIRWVNQTGLTIPGIIFYKRAHMARRVNSQNCCHGSLASHVR